MDIRISEHREVNIRISVNPVVEMINQYLGILAIAENTEIEKIAPVPYPLETNKMRIIILLHRKTI